MDRETLKTQNQDCCKKTKFVTSATNTKETQAWLETKNIQR